jgi:type IV pilus assembly protein PilB
MQLLTQVIQSCQLLSNQQLKSAIKDATFHNEPLISYLINRQLLPAMLIAKSCGRFYYLPYEDLRHYTIDALEPLQKKHENFPGIILKKTNAYLKVAIACPEQLKAVEDYKWQIRIQLSIVFVEYDVFTRYQSTLKCSSNIFNELKNNIQHELQKILQEAVDKKASDIHFEPHKFQYRIRQRIDGCLYELRQMDITQAQAMTNCLKVMANLDIAENRLPQDGQFNFYSHRHITHPCRVSTCRTLFGEKCVIRVLATHNKLLKFDQLGLTNIQQNILIQTLKKSQGLILVTGPTGSGKTITLYTALKYLNTIDKNIYSAEDPVEIELLGIHQVNINVKIGLTFAKALRAFLRQDPDIMMIGEIRDVETAHTAIRAAQTGHLVLSTLHTNSAIDTLKCLKKMAIHPFDLAETLQLVIAQRLVRKLCKHCKKITQKNTFIAQNCDRCINGYNGRTGIYELMPLSEKIHEAILSNTNQHAIKALAIKEGMQFLYANALEKVKTGITSLSEMHRVL